MNNKIFGATSMIVERRFDEAMRIQLELVAHPDYDPRHLYDEDWKNIFAPEKVIIQCVYCKSMNAITNATCVRCGAPMGDSHD